MSLELGGAPRSTRLWPQPWSQARPDDRLGNLWHRQVCAGTLTLRQARRGKSPTSTPTAEVELKAPKPERRSF